MDKWRTIVCKQYVFTLIQGSFMKKITQLTLIASLFALPSSVYANWFGAIGYNHLNDTVEIESNLNVFDVDSKAITISLGYQYNFNETFSTSAEFSFGHAISDGQTEDIRYSDLIERVNIELDSTAKFSIMTQYQLNPSLFLFVAPVYSKIEYKSQGFQLNSNNKWQLGAEIGVGYQFKNNMGLAISYEGIDDAKIISAKLKYHF